MDAKSKLSSVPIDLIEQNAKRFFAICEQATKAAQPVDCKLSVCPADVLRDLDMLAKVLGDNGISKPTLR